MANIIAIKSEDFAVRIINLARYLREQKQETIISKQIFRSGTSIGANVSESNNAQSKSDFENKLNIALKEADETAYWLRILKRTDYLTKEEFDSIYSDVTEIIAILIASKRTSRGENPKKNGNSSTSPHKE